MSCDNRLPNGKATPTAHDPGDEAPCSPASQVSDGVTRWHTIYTHASVNDERIQQGDYSEEVRSLSREVLSRVRDWTEAATTEEDGRNDEMLELCLSMMAQLMWRLSVEEGEAVA